MFEAYRLSPPLETTAPLIAAALKLTDGRPLPLFIYLQAQRRPRADQRLRGTAIRVAKLLAAGNVIPFPKL